MMEIKRGIFPLLSHSVMFKRSFNQANHLRFIRRQYCRRKLYVQGQSPEPSVREYFYFIDHQGMVRNINNFHYMYRKRFKCAVND